MMREPQLTRTILDLFAAGTETTSSALRWAIVYLIHNPDIQEKMRQEIYSVVGSSQVPKLHHQQNMPYTEAVLAEIQRCGEIVPLSIFHGVDKETKFHGFRIPKDAIITPNLDSVLSESKEFLEPQKFEPSRFLDEDGNFRYRQHSIPFSIGRRVCLGESLAKAEMFLFLTAIVQRFTFAPEGKKPPSTEPIVGSTRAPKRFKFRAMSVL
ncbi:hypothetical protein KUTeg_024235 [Tegillarca granosa]|uniref:Uncharacterized protein n=1 Tax=Tegillarca granosa TaxID=220873 RepID=A0ABQ9E0V5_TEGGR|nr:hypothetical protein KUTeg_024235 [Tegillarca granosa]